MKAYEIQDLLQQREASGKLYHEFLRVPSMSMGIYTLEKGGKDPQNPHAEDEVYYVVSGKGMIHVSGEDRDVVSGSIVFVAAEEIHYFHSIEETLEILVFFAPPET